MSALLSTDLKLKQLCRATGEPGFHNYTTLQGHLLSAIIDLNIYTLPCWSLASLPITSFNTVNWTCDCVKPLITVLERQGKHYLLSVSDELVETLTADKTGRPNDTECGPEDLFQIDGFIETFGWSIWAWGLGELYGAESMRPPFGIVIHDEKKRRSFIKRLRLQTGDSVKMFFKSSGLDECPTFIPAKAEQVVEYFILMKWYETRQPSLSDDMERKYKERLFRLRRFDQDGSEDEWVRSMNSNTKSSPKF